MAVGRSCTVFYLLGAAVFTGVRSIKYNCPKYLEEGSTLTCQCQFEGLPSSDAYLHWPGYSDNFVLTIPRVNRTLNGSQYTCQLVSSVRNETVDYTLQVAYGPIGVNISASEPQPIAVNGTKPVTLTCLALEVNPTPAYNWSGISCNNGNLGNTCIFTPSSSDDQRTVTCEAVNNFAGPSGETARKLFTLDLNYPPPDSPEITGYTSGQPLSTGDNLTCTVRGGKPLVELILFRCVNHNVLDQQDRIESNFVSSSLTINTSLATSANLSCVCSAFWNTEPNLYAMNNAIVNVLIDYVSTSGTTTLNTASTTEIPISSTIPTTTSASTIVGNATTFTPVVTTGVIITETTPQSTTVTPSTTSSIPATPVSELTSTPTQQIISTDTSTTSKAVSTATIPASSPGNVSTASGATDQSVTESTDQGGQFHLAALIGALVGAFVLILIIIIVVVFYRWKKERDPALVSSNEFTDGSYKPSSNDHFYNFENNAYDSGEKSEMQPHKPLNGDFPPTVAMVESNSPLMKHNQYAASTIDENAVRRDSSSDSEVNDDKHEEYTESDLFAELNKPKVSENPEAQGLLSEEDHHAAHDGQSSRLDNEPPANHSENFAKTVDLSSGSGQQGKSSDQVIVWPQSSNKFNEHKEEIDEDQNIAYTSF